jgi:hypothetical protein
MADYTVSADLEVNDKASAKLNDVGDAAQSSAASIKEFGEVGGQAESTLRGFAGVLSLISPQMANAVGVAAELGGGLEAAARGSTLLSKSMGSAAPAIVAVAGATTLATAAFVGAGVAIVGAVAAADDFAAALNEIEGVEGLGVSPEDVAILKSANAAMTSIGVVGKQLVTIFGAEMAPAVEAGATQLVKLGLIAVDVFNAFADGQDILAAFANFVGREVVQALLAPVDALASLIQQMADLSGVLGQAELAGKLNELTASWDAFATAAAQKGANLIGAGIGSVLEGVGVDLDSLDARAKKLIGEVQRIEGAAAAGGGGAAGGAGADAGDGTGVGLALAQQQRELSLAFKGLADQITRLGGELPIDAATFSALAMNEQKDAITALTGQFKDLTDAAKERADADRKAAEERAAQAEKAANAAADASAAKGDMQAQAVAGALTGSLAATLAPVLSALGPQGAIAGAVLSLLEQGPEVVQEVLMAIPESIGKIVESVGALPEMIPDLVTSLIEVLPGVLITLLLQQSGIMAVQLVAALVESLPEIIESTIAAMIELLIQLPQILVELLDIPGLLLATTRALPGMLLDAAVLAGPVLADALRLAALDVKTALIREFRQALRDLNPFAEGRSERMRDAFKIDFKARIDMDGRRVSELLDLARDRRRGGA